MSKETDATGLKHGGCNQSLRRALRVGPVWGREGRKVEEGKERRRKRTPEWI